MDQLHTVTITVSLRAKKFYLTASFTILVIVSPTCQCGGLEAVV